MIRKWHAETGHLLGEMVGHRARIADLQLSPDGHTLISAGVAGDILLWRLETGVRLGQFDISRHGTRNLVITPDGNRLFLLNLNSETRSVLLSR